MSFSINASRLMTLHDHHSEVGGPWFGSRFDEMIYHRTTQPSRKIEHHQFFSEKNSIIRGMGCKVALNMEMFKPLVLS